MRRVACIGAGVIGAGWAVHFLARGYEVVVWDPMKDLRARVERFVVDAWNDVTRRGAAAPEWASRLSCAATLDQAVNGADFVQESVPERFELKREVIASIDARAAADVVIASSTSGFTPTQIQQGLSGARRVAFVWG